MQRQFASFALLVYLLGGWLLPACHYHAGHDQCAADHAGQACGADGGGNAELAASGERSRGNCACTAKSCDATTAASDESDESVSEFGRLVGGNGPESLGHHGLCAVCVAKTMASFDTLDRSLVFERIICPANQVRLDLFLAQECYGIALSRGPPCVA